MGDGLIRFKLDDPDVVEVSFGYPWDDFQKSWLAQSSRIIDAHGMSGMEEKCFIINPPYFKLSSPQLGHHRYPITLKDRPPIYLFIYPPPSSISELKSWGKGHTRTHFWSLDENGQSEMSEEDCRRWGIPELGKSLDWDYLKLRSWPTDVYTALRKWQVARGFDPSTADWAQSLGYPELEIIGGKEEEARFEGVHDGVSYLRKLHRQDVESQLRSPAQVQCRLRTRRYSWSTDVHTDLHNRQVARGFKHTTSNWTQHLRSLEFEIIGAKKEEARLEEVFDHAEALCELREEYAGLRWEKSLLAAEAKAEAEVKSEPISKLDDILESSALVRDPSIESVENTPQASPYDEQGALPEQNDPLFAQETPKEETKKASSWWSWEAITGSGISACM
ncbi:hypothetical protein VNI00_015733 [Paramarasmius palmivorus]|uniref:Uncharacterized protein n=1 Tax=Paramarasmius palmivorus TaxID=297713 RepID=A0AAW0BK16_9AGAR